MQKMVAVAETHNGSNSRECPWHEDNVRGMLSYRWNIYTHPSQGQGAIMKDGAERLQEPECGEH